MLSTKTKENQTGRLIVVGIGVTPGEGRDHVPHRGRPTWSGKFSSLVGTSDKV